jgi:hypothetical protein
MTPLHGPLQRRRARALLGDRHGWSGQGAVLVGPSSVPPPLLPYRASTEPAPHAAAAHAVGVLDVDAPRDPVAGARRRPERDV